MADLPADVGTGIVNISVRTVGLVSGASMAAPVLGLVTFTPSCTEFLHAGDDLIFPATPVSVYLDRNGDASITLMATNDPQIAPLNFTYTVSFKLDSSLITIAPFQISVPEGTIRALADITPVPGPGGGTASGRDAAMTKVDVTDDLVYSPPAPDAESGILNILFVQDSVGGHTITRYPNVLLAAGANWEVSMEPDSESVAVFRPRADGTGWVCEGAWISLTSSMANADLVPPAPGTLSSYGVSDTVFSLAVTGAADAIGLHLTPYAFSTDGGSTFSAWQSGSTFTKNDATASTQYACEHKVRDAAGNISDGTPITVTTSALPADVTPPTWTATFTMGTPGETSVTATASSMATDNVGVTGYEVSYNNGTSWDAITPSGSVFTLAGDPGTTYNTTKLRARDAAANTTSRDVPTYTMAAAVPPVGNPANLAEAVANWGAIGYWKLDETTGTTITDSSGNGHHGTLAGTPSTDYILSDTGDRLNFLSDVAKITIPDDPDLSIPTLGLSVFATVYQGGGGGNRSFIAKNGASGAEWDITISYQRPRAAAVLDSGSGGASSVMTGEISANTWHGLAFAIKRAVDGVPVIWVDSGTPQECTETPYTTGTITGNTIQPVTFGGSWIGVMGYVMIFPFALTNAHAQKLMDLARSAGLIP